MKLIWSTDHKSVILIAETAGEVVIADVLTADLNAHRYMTKGIKGEPPTMVKYTIKPSEE